MTMRNVLVLVAAAALTVAIDAGQGRAAEIINVGAVYRTGGLLGDGTWEGFPDFMKPADTNATTRAWNFNGSTQTLNGVVVTGTAGNATSAPGGLSIFNATNAHYNAWLNWTSDPAQQTAKNEISRGGRWTPAPNSWSVDIAATPGREYEVQVLSLPASVGNNRSLDVIVDGVMFADNLYVPGASPLSVVHKFPVTADADGIDITFGAGADFDKNPYVTAIAVTDVGPASAYADAVHALNPHAYLRLGENAGATAFNEVGYPTGENGEYQNGPTLGVAGIPGGGGDTAVDFDGASSRVRIMDPHDPTDYTLTAWVKMDTFPGGWQNILWRTDSGESNAFSHILQVIEDGGGDMVFKHYTWDGAARQVTGTTPIQPGQWHHVAGVYHPGSPGYMSLYVDGQLDFNWTGNLNNPWTGGDRWLIADSHASGANFDGTIDDVAIFHTLLTAEQIAGLYEAGITSNAEIPEPCTLVLTALGLSALAGRIRRRRKT